MRSEVRIGRLRGTGSVINLTAANQVIGGLATWLEVPRGCMAVCTITGLMTNGANSTVIAGEVDYSEIGPVIFATGTNGQVLGGAATFEVGPGRHMVRVNTRGSTAAGQVFPTDVTLSWVIAPRGGIAN